MYLLWFMSNKTIFGLITVFLVQVLVDLLRMDNIKMIAKKLKMSQVEEVKNN